MTSNLPSNFPDAINALTQGHLIAYPTEAVYGLGCDPLNESAVHNLLALKHRNIAKGLILIAASVAQIAPYIDSAAVPDEKNQQAIASWPGPFTWVYPATSLVPSWIRGHHNTVAVRVTAHPIVKALCEAFSRPLVSTSANLDGQPPAKDAVTVAKIFPQGIDVIVPGAVGHLTKPTEIRDVMTGQIIRL